jgi:hypothetical protein
VARADAIQHANRNRRRSFDLSPWVRQRVDLTGLELPAGYHITGSYRSMRGRYSFSLWRPGVVVVDHYEVLDPQAVLASLVDIAHVDARERGEGT